MSEFYGVSSPKDVRDILSLFSDSSSLETGLLSILAGFTWFIGFILMQRTYMSLILGGVFCGLILGAGFIRSKGGPSLNLIISGFLPPLLAGFAGLIGFFPIDAIYELKFQIYNVFPSFFSTLGIMIIWFIYLGKANIEAWHRKNMPEEWLIE